MGVALNRFGFNTITMGGNLGRKLAHVKSAGFSGIELWAKDLVDHADGVEAAAELVRASGLKVTDFQPLRDFEGAPDAMRAHRLTVAREHLRQMQLVGADMLLVCSAVSPLTIDDPERAAEDLRTLSTLATPLGIRICYEALSWGRHVNRWHQAWDIVRRCDRANVGLNLDSFHMAVRGDATAEAIARLREVPVDKIFLVQLADYFFEYSSSPADIIELARHQRLFPGEGLHDVRDLVQTLESMGYAGHYTFEVFNDDYVASDPAVVAQRGIASARWVADGVLQPRALPIS
jgi:sugar phosphate isomerase/epimerase